MEGLRPGRQLGQDLEPADDRLDDVDDAAADTARRTRRGMAGAASGAPRPTIAATISPTTIAIQRCRTCGGRQIGQRREERPAHQRPVREDERAVRSRGRDLRPEQEQGVRRRGAERGQQREPLARAATADPGREVRPDEEVDEQAEERLRGRQVGGDATRRCCPRRTVCRPRYAWKPTSSHRPERRPQRSSAGRGGRRQATHRLGQDRARRGPRRPSGGATRSRPSGR